jgi:chromate transporter
MMISMILHSCYRLAKLGMEDWVQWRIAFACFFDTMDIDRKPVLRIMRGAIE